MTIPVLGRVELIRSLCEGGMGGRAPRDSNTGGREVIASLNNKIEINNDFIYISMIF